MASSFDSFSGLFSYYVLLAGAALCIGDTTNNILCHSTLYILLSYYHHHHYPLANMDFGHLLTHSVLTQL
jgi:hypothetical protein